GRGYAAPRPKFRWCTERLKIRPSNKFILDVANKYGQVILVLGIRKAESTTRRRTMERHEKGRVRDRLSPHGSLPGSLVYSPVEAWTTDEVWMALMQ
ncbi:DNA phosphorothioation system sulfurtransferase DndC, partial [Streptomyces sp. SID6648]|nr:DNA phosphorothioation system sulfurtransferase DndC [Streptomyces sp. SID6648]